MAVRATFVMWDVLGILEMVLEQGSSVNRSGFIVLNGYGLIG